MKQLYVYEMIDDSIFAEDVIDSKRLDFKHFLKQFKIVCLINQLIMPLLIRNLREKFKFRRESGRRFCF